MLELCTDFKIASIFFSLSVRISNIDKNMSYKFGRVFDSPSKYTTFKWIRSSDMYRLYEHRHFIKSMLRRWKLNVRCLVMRGKPQIQHLGEHRLTNHLWIVVTKFKRRMWKKEASKSYTIYKQTHATAYPEKIS